MLGGLEMSSSVSVREVFQGRVRYALCEGANRKLRTSLHAVASKREALVWIGV